MNEQLMIPIVKICMMQVLKKLNYSFHFCPGSFVFLMFLIYSTFHVLFRGIVLLVASASSILNSCLIVFTSFIPLH